MELYNGFSYDGWTRILNDPYYEKSLKKTVEIADTYIVNPPSRHTFSSMHLFVQTGDRRIFEESYNDLKGRVEILFMAYLITKNEKYLPHLCDAIWDVCNMESWGLSAHVPETESLDKRRCWLELCSCHIGRLFGEILMLISDILPELIVRRMKKEVRERIIESFEKYDFWWYTSENNWSSVCISGVLASYIYVADKDETLKMLPKMQKSAECYLKGFDSEGCCKEGYGYWGYGFRYFCLFAELLRNFTNGKINYFENPKVHAIAKFQEHMSINDKECIRFSDADAAFNPPLPLTHFLKKIYADVQIPSIPAPNNPLSLHEYFWCEPKFEHSDMRPQSHIFHENQWFIYRGEKYNFVCKAGSNSEPHNHLDVGSFMISSGGAVSFTDPGTAEYTRQYFDQSTRYNIAGPAARSHSVPIIDGSYQIKSSKKSQIFKQTPEEYAFSMEGAYNVDSLKTFKRHFICEKEKVIMIDSYVFSSMPKSIKERFVTLNEPIVETGKIRVKNTTLSFNPDKYSVSVTTETITRKSGKEELIYMIDLSVSDLSLNTEVTVEFY